MEKRSSLPSPPRSSVAIFVFLTVVPSLASAASLHNSLWARPRIPPPAEIFGRASTCGDSSYIQCSSADLPSDFCCPSGQSCIPLAGNTTVICCPSGSDCAEIETIPCDLSLEDKSQHPAAVVMTSALTGTLETCGDQCCPFGYSCNGNSNCVVNEDQTAKPSTSSVTSSTTATATSGSGTTSAAVQPTTGTTGSSASATSTSSSGSGSGSGSSAAADSTSTSASDSGSGSGASSSGSSAVSSQAGAIAGGVIAGVAGLVLLGFLILFCVKKERRRKEAQKITGDGSTDSARSSGSFGNILASPVTRGGSAGRRAGAPPNISKPILMNEDMVRSDFGRMKSPHTPIVARDANALGPGGVSEYYGEKSSHGGYDDDHEEEEEDGGWDDACDDDDDEAAKNIHDVPRSPPRLTTPRAVSSMYASYYDPTRASEYQAPVRMPSAVAFGGQNSWDTDGPLGNNYGSGGAGQRTTGDTGADYIDVFADSGALAPPPLRSLSGDRVTRFSDVINDAKEMGRDGGEGSRWNGK